MRPGDELGVIAFWSTAVVLRPLSADPRVDVVVDRLCDLRGGGTTDLELALQTAAAQIARSRAADRQVLLLSDGMATESPDPVNAASALARIPARLQVLALSGEEEAMASCAALAAAGGGRVAAAAPAESGALGGPGAARLRPLVPRRLEEAVVARTRPTVSDDQLPARMSAAISSAGRPHASAIPAPAAGAAAGRARPPGSPARARAGRAATAVRTGAGSRAARPRAGRRPRGARPRVRSGCRGRWRARGRPSGRGRPPGSARRRGRR